MNMVRVYGNSLYDPQYVEQVNNVISNTKRQYAVPVYTMDDINDIPDSELQLSINDNLFLETFLMNIRGETISYATFKKKNTKDKETENINKLENMEQNITDENIEEYNRLKEELNQIRQERLIRSKTQQIEESEKPSSYHEP